MKLVKCLFERKDERGTFREYINENSVWKSINGGLMKQGAIMGNHYHKKCDTLLFLISGSADIFIKDIRNETSEVKKFKLNKNEGVIFEPYETHANVFLEDSQFLLLKSEKFDKNDEDIYPSKVI